MDFINIFLNLLTDMLMKDKEQFVRRVTQIKVFNFEARDFLSLRYKKQIQSIIGLNWFPGFDLNKKTLKSLNVNSFNRAVSELRKESPEHLYRLYYTKLTGMGPGEVLLYFLLNNARLGGSNSAGVDLIDGGKNYEIKAVKVNGKNQAYDFKIGGTAELAPIQTAFVQLATKYKVPGTTSEFNKTNLTKLKQLAPTEYSELENRYIDAAYKYFKGHDVIFMSGKTSTLGNILTIKKVKRSDISMERITSNTIKPLIQL